MVLFSPFAAIFPVIVAGGMSFKEIPGKLWVSYVKRRVKGKTKSKRSRAMESVGERTADRKLCHISGIGMVFPVDLQLPVH
jgi:hypothetical protein